MPNWALTKSLTLGLPRKVSVVLRETFVSLWGFFLTVLIPPPVFVVTGITAWTSKEESRHREWQEWHGHGAFSAPSPGGALLDPRLPLRAGVHLAQGHSAGGVGRNIRGRQQGSSGCHHGRRRAGPHAAPPARMQGALAAAAATVTSAEAAAAADGRAGAAMGEPPSNTGGRLASAAERHTTTDSG